MMRKLLGLTLAATLLTAVCAACVDDDGNQTTATVTYYGQLGAVQFTDSTNVGFTHLIGEGLNDMGYTGEKSIFTESDTLDYNSSYAATHNCNVKASAAYRIKVNTLTLAALKEAMFGLHADSLTRLGYASASELPLDTLMPTLYLYNTLGTVPVDTFTLVLHP